VRRAGVLLAIVVLVGVAAARCAGMGRSEGRSVAFAAPVDGATVTSPVRLEMRARGLTVEPTGPIRPNAGHFHVMVDNGCFRRGAFVEMRTVGFEHFGDGTDTGTLELSPGRHTLCLQMGNGAHVTLAPTDEITITVK
jgi:hypothetical protein